MTRSLSMPLTVVTGGSLRSIEQGSGPEIAQAVALLLATTPGERRVIPDFGMPNPVGPGLDQGVVADVIGEWEDRADPATITLEVIATADQRAQVFGPLDDDTIDGES